FTLLTSSTGYLPGIGQEFYGGATDQVAQNVVLEAYSVHQDVTVTATGIPTPIEQTSSAVTQIPQEALATLADLPEALRQSPGVFVAQQGQYGGVTSLFVRGGSSTANEVLIDGIPAIDVGGTFDFGTVSTTGLAGLEIYRGPNSALYGTDAGASVVNLETPRGTARSLQVDDRRACIRSVECGVGTAINLKTGHPSGRDGAEVKGPAHVDCGNAVDQHFIRGRASAAHKQRRDAAVLPLLRDKHAGRLAQGLGQIGKSCKRFLWDLRYRGTSLFDGRGDARCGNGHILVNAVGLEYDVL